MKIIFMMLLIFSGMISSVFAESLITFDVSNDKLIPGEIIELKGKVPIGMEEQPVAVEIKDSEGNVILIRTISSDASGNFILKFKVPNDVTPGAMDIVTNIEIEGQTFSDTKTVQVETAPEPVPEKTSETQPICGKGTELVDGTCQVIKTEKTTESKGGGCLIATAAYGSEMAPQVQFLREIRDNKVMSTSSGVSFMTGFNQFYYSFSPTIADMERENSVFKEMVKIGITPMLSSLSIMSAADTEQEIVGYGIGVILMNIGMYFVAPIVMIHQIKKKLDS